MLKITRICVFIILMPVFYAHSQLPQHSIDKSDVIPPSFATDFDSFWNQINDDYPYFSKKTTNWSCVKSLYRPQAALAKSRHDFIQILELAINELYDPHASLNVNLSSSTRLIPSGLDVWAEWQEDRAYVTQLRPGFPAEHAGLRVGMEIISVNGLSIRKAVDVKLGKCITQPGNESLNWALLAVLAGQHDTVRTISVRSVSGEKTFNVDAPNSDSTDRPAVTSRKLDDNLGYIALHDLGSTDSIAVFDEAIQDLKNTRGLIIDLRDTPGGGNTRVAEPIMGRLINQDRDYQRVLPTHGEAWSARVQSRGSWTYTAPVVVLVSRWTGSMGEGMAIGLDGMHRATIVGTPMAGLNGGVFTHNLPYSDINFTIPGEALLHLNGIPREFFKPSVLVDFSHGNPVDVHDVILDEGIIQLKKYLISY